MRPFFLLIILLLLQLQIKAAPQLNYEFESLSTKNGLSNNSTTSILQDRYGFIWIGTQNGLNRYDGNSFLIFRHDADNLNSLSSNVITCLIEDTYGNLWIGTGLGLNRFNPKTGIFRSFIHESENENSLSHNYIESLLEDDKGNIWVGTKGGGLNFLNSKEVLNDSISFERIQFQAKNPNLYIETIYQDSQGHIWVGSESNLILILNFQNKERKEIKYFELATTDVSEKIIFNLSEGRNGNLLATLHELGVWEFSYSPQKKDLIFKRQIINAEKAKLNSKVLLSWTNLIDSKGNLWVSTIGEGILHINNFKNSENSTIQQIVKNHENSNSLPDNSIKDILEDKSGIIWLCTSNHGVAKYNPKSKAFTKISSKLGYCENISSIVETKSGNLIIGTNGFDGLFSYEFNGKGFDGILKPLDWTSSKNIRSIIRDDKGNFWIAENNEGVCVYNEQGEKIRQYLKSNDGSNSLSHNYVLKLFQDSQKRIWIGSWGSSQTGGLDLYDPASDKFTNFKFDPKSEKGLSQNVVFSIAEDYLGHIWVGTQSEGVNVIKIDDYENYSIEKLKYRLGDKTSVDNNYINFIFSDSQNNIWVATQSGLNRYNFESGNFTRVNFLNELNKLSIRNIVEDVNGNLWLGTSAGLVKYNPSNNQSTKYDHNDGIYPLDYTYGIKLQHRQGVVYGGLEGIVAFIPSKIAQNDFSTPPLIISDIKISNLDKEHSENARLQYIIPTKSEIILPFNENTFSLKYAALDYTITDKVRFAYRLVGYDDNEQWHYLPRGEQYVNYSNLREGQYAFQVNVTDEQGVWGKNPKSLHIQVLPPFFRTKFAYIVYMLTFFALLYVVIALILRRQEEKNKAEMERNERQRIEELNKTKLVFFTNISHEFRTPLTLILASIEKILSPNTIISDEKRNVMILRVRKNADRLLRLINQLMDFRKIDSGKLKLKVVENDMVDFLKSIYSYFSDQAEINAISYQFETSHDTVMAYFDSDKLEKAVFNLLSNAFKHTPEKGKILVKLIKNENEIVVTIINSGKGIPPQDLPKVFDRFYQVSNSNMKDSYVSGTGVGLSLAKDFIEMHKGHISVQSKENEDTCFTIKLLTGSEHLNPDDIVSLQSTNEKLVDVQGNIISPQLQNEISSDSEIEIENYVKPHLLIVDDNVEMRNLLKEVFYAGYIVNEAGNGFQALDQIEKSRPDIIISDVMMPDMDGFELCKILKTNLNTSHIPVILLTAKSTVESQIEGLETGADAYVSKPFNMNVLEVQGRKLLEVRKKLKKLYSYSLEPNSKELTTSSLDEIFLSKAISIVEDHLNDPELSVEIYCKKIGLAKTTLHEKLKALTGKPTGDFIRSIRLKHAVKFLNKGEMNVSEVCFSVGFNTVWYFSKCFKNEYGISPSEYLKSKKNL